MRPSILLYKVAVNDLLQGFRLDRPAILTAAPFLGLCGFYAERFPEVRAMAKKAKDARSYVKLVSSESDHCYFVQKNRNNTKGRLELRKYDPTVRKHVPYKESK
jgi:large subunit ribosomal protein L33